jgi:CxxC-x17-CxxC domain-containing protein
MVEFADKKITCIDCGAEFIHTAGQQEFFAKMNFTSEPKRCKACRDKKKSGGGGGPGGGGDRPPRRAAQSSTADNDALLGGGGRSGGGGGDRGGDAPRGERGGYGGGGGGFGGPREMFDAVCAECGSPTQVPFRPRGDRPVYCRNCYQSKRTR